MRVAYPLEESQQKFFPFVKELQLTHIYSFLSSLVFSCGVGGLSWIFVNIVAGGETPSPNQGPCHSGTSTSHGDPIPPTSCDI
jgi:hypothetical protein